MHVQHYPPVTPLDPEQEVEDNLRRAYRTPPPRGLPSRLEELIDLLRHRTKDPRPFPLQRRTLSRGPRR